MRLRSLTAIFAFRLCAIFSIAAEPPADVSKLAEQLAASDRDTRREAGYRLEKLGPAAKSALPALIKALDPEWAGPEPHTILVAPGGAIAFRHTGKLSEVELLEKLLAVLTPYYQP